MKHLVGRSFTLGDGSYRIVDVQRLGGDDAMVYAEPVPCAEGAAGQPVAAGPRTAFHYGDIARLLECERGA